MNTIKEKLGEFLFGLSLLILMSITILSSGYVRKMARDPEYAQASMENQKEILNDIYQLVTDSDEEWGWLK